MHYPFSFTSSNFWSGVGFKKLIVAQQLKNDHHFMIKAMGMLYTQLDKTP
jgi:hypothetical protein